MAVTGRKKAELDLGDIVDTKEPNGASNKKTQAQSYLNIGVGVGDNFISIPIGVGVDTQSPLEIRGQNAEWNAKAAAMNKLLEKLQKLAEGLEPGEEVMLPQLSVQLRKRKDAAQVDDAHNEHMAIVDAIDFGI